MSTKLRFAFALLVAAGLISPVVTEAQTVRVLGQPDFTSNAVGHDANGLNFPLGMAVDAKGGVYVADRNNHRVVYFADDGDGKADRVYGQHGKFDTYIVNYDGVGGSGAPSADTLNNPTYATLDSVEGLYVADRDNHRVLYYAPDGDTTADKVYGQFGSFVLNVVNNDGSNLISGTGLPSADNLGVYALTLAVDSSNGLYISDSSNHRVLYFANDGNTTADKVYGQFGSFTTNSKNNDGTGNAGVVSANSMNFPRGVAFDSKGGLYIADRDNHRVLYFAPDGDTTADRVYGQAGNFATNVPNNDGSGATGAPSTDNFITPRSLAIDAADGMYVMDAGNSRVLYFKADGDTTADWVFGQAGSFTTGVANNDGAGSAGKPSADNLNIAQAIALRDGKLYISDTGNNRVLIVPIQQ